MRAPPSRASEFEWLDPDQPGDRPMHIDLDKKVDKYRVFRGRSEDFGGFSLANITTKHHRGPEDTPEGQVGTSRGGDVVYDPLPRKDWRLHFTSPEMTLEEVAAIVAAYPQEA